MSQTPNDNTTRSILITAWGMATLVLIFCVALLARELYHAGPTATTVPTTPRGRVAISNSSADDTIGTKEVALYFAAPSLPGVLAETRRIEFSDSTTENCKRTLLELINGPRHTLLPTLPPTTKVRGVFLLKSGELIVDFSRELEAGMPQSLGAELLMIQSITQTLTQPALRGAAGPTIRSIRFLFEGSTSQDTFPTHLDISGSLSPDEKWIRPRSESPPNA